MAQFNVPAPPYMVFPRTPQTIAEVVLWIVVVAVVAFAVHQWRRTGSPLGLALLAGGGIALFNEPLDDILGLVHHPGRVRTWSSKRWARSRTGDYPPTS